MIFKLRLGRWRITFSVAPLTTTFGVHSVLPNGKHVLMWDFDDTELKVIIRRLSMLRVMYNLSDIYILNTGKPNNYIAYCFTAVPWRTAVEIIAQCPEVDWNFYKYSIYRGKFSLRVGEKCGRKIKLAYIIKSGIEPTVKPRDLDDWVRYETVEDGFKQRKIELRVYASDDT